MAAANAAAVAHNIPLYRLLGGDAAVTLPLPEVQIFGGGAHASRRVDIQDFMVMPLAASSFSEAMNMTADIYRAAAELMQDDGKLQGVADEGGFWPVFDSNEEALTTLTRAIERATEKNLPVLIPSLRRHRPVCRHAKLGQAAGKCR